MKSLPRLALLILLVATTGLALWQQARIKNLVTESAALRQQLAMGLAKGEQTDSASKPTLTPETRESPSSEVLRLRGEIAVLKSQLAEEVGSNATKRAQSLAQAKLARELEVAADEDRLDHAQQQVEVAKQKVTALLTGLQIGRDVSEDDAVGAMSAEDLQLYREAKQGAEEAERFVQACKLKVELARGPGERPQPRTGQ